MTVRLAALFSRFLGATATHLWSVFQEMPRPGVYLFDEFDAIGQARADAQDVGEMRRVVTAFLQFIDADRSPSILVAATNHAELLDRAVFRRFDVVLAFEQPTEAAIVELLALRLPLGAYSTEFLAKVATRTRGLTFADVARACDNALRTMVLAGETRLRAQDLDSAIDAAARRASEQPRSQG